MDGIDLPFGPRSELAKVAETGGQTASGGSTASIITSQRQTSPAVSGSSSSSSQKTPSSQRWVPASAREQMTPRELVFRKIRGILNKLTPENFGRLTTTLLSHDGGINDKETLKGAILLIFDKALDEPSYSSTYAQLCLRLNNFGPNFEDPRSQNTTFKKLLLHKCQEEFENRRRASAAFDKHDRLTPEEEEQKTLAKRKMLGNIKFVGELFKLGILHEAIIHNCIKELLEKKKHKHQTLEDAYDNIECLCHFMTTVGKKLDTEKAKGWMDKYFGRMEVLCNMKDQPSRIRFMLMDVIELRNSNWQPRRASVENGPRTIKEIRQAVYQEKHSPHSGRAHGSSHPPPPLDIPPYGQQLYRGQSSAHAQYAPPPGPAGDEGFLSSPPSGREHLLSPQDTVPPSFLPGHHHTNKEVVSETGANLMTAGGNKPATAGAGEKKSLRKPPSMKSGNNVSLRPSTSLKQSSSSSRSKSPTVAKSNAESSVNTKDETEGKGQTKVRGESGRTALPRTRDDSSDEEGAPPIRAHPAKAGPIPMPRGPFPPHGMYPPPSGPYAPPPMMPPGGIPYTRGPRPGPPMSGTGVGRPPLPHGPPGPMMYMPPHGHMLPPPPGGPMGQFGPLPPHPQGFYGPPPPGRPMPPPMYGGPPPRIPGPYAPPPWGTPPSEHVPMPPPLIDGDKSSRPPRLDRKEEVVVKYASSKLGKKSGSGNKKMAQSDNEKIMKPIVTQFLESLDTEKAVEDIRALNLSKDVICSLLITTTLRQSEVARTHISDLLKQLHTEEEITSVQLLQAINSVMSRSGDMDSDLSQWKTYLAGFIARGIAQDILELSAVAPTFNNGAHHPTALVVLQALTAILGEDAVYQKMQVSGVKLVSLLPVEYRSHDAISELMTSKKLGFLYPLKRIQTELASKLRHDSSAVTIYKWIKTSVDQSFYGTTEFVMVLTRCILEHVTSGSTLSPMVDRKENPSKDIVSKEKDLMEKFTIIVDKFVSEDVQLQMSVLHATQLFCYDKQFPRGLLLRLFSYWYDMDVIEEEVFFKWKEDISQEYPGKGKALFQVNQWLILLAEEEEDTSSDED